MYLSLSFSIINEMLFDSAVCFSYITLFSPPCLFFSSLLSSSFIVCLFIFLLQEKIESATDVLKEILKPVVAEAEEVPWPPRDPEALKLMEKVSLFLNLV